MHTCVNTHTYAHTNIHTKWTWKEERWGVGQDNRKEEGERDKEREREQSHKGRVGKEEKIKSTK